MTASSSVAPRIGRPRRAALRALVPCVLVGAAGIAPARSADPPREDPACESVRLADVGWTDVTATTALLSSMLRDLGYRPHTPVLSVPVTFASMKRGDIDVFLGNWMPAQEADRRPFVAEGSIEVLGVNLAGAKYTLAAPAYSYEAGLR